MHLPIPTPPRNTDNGCNTQQVEPSTKKDREKVVSPATLKIVISVLQITIHWVYLGRFSRRISVPYWLFVLKIRESQ